MSTAPYRLGQFVRDLEAIHDRLPAMPVKVEQATACAERLLADPGWLDPEFRRPVADHYARYLLHRDAHNRFVVLTIVWLPGQGTPVHDHSCWGIMGMVEGQLEVVNYDRLDDGSRPAYAELRESGTEIVDHMETGFVLPPYQEIHLIANRSAKPAVSLHVYGRDLDEVNVYDLVTRKVSRMRIKYYNVDCGMSDFVI